MMQLAKKHEFEKAGEVKRQIFALKHINDIALIKQDVSQKNAFTQVLGSPVHKSKKEQAQPDHSQKHFSATQDFRGESESIFSEGKTYSTFRIEAYDVAHMSGRNMVGVMTVVEDGEINKNEYRKFKIKTQSGANDTGALGEIIERRLVHTEWNYPNLIVVDGGKAQINAVEKIFKKVGIGIPIVSVLKDEKHKPKDILGRRDLATKYEKEILLANSEAHRFAISYHKQMRGKNFLK